MLIISNNYIDQFIYVPASKSSMKPSTSGGDSKHHIRTSLEVQHEAFYLWWGFKTAVRRDISTKHRGTCFVHPSCCRKAWIDQSCWNGSRRILKVPSQYHRLACCRSRSWVGVANIR
ncbi:uncharacterized protein LOC117341661 [Pecten maximus]|uniref:uncharacterized protein LOC117341661 n=1 Tax=Pecten maximus TaxID=6579 RepID=UPI001458C452|nr:uncharacterized protein LOC117341661 [Pecten maximus]